MLHHTAVGTLAVMVVVLPLVDHVAATTTTTRLVDLLARPLVQLGDRHVLNAKSAT
jgi:hypothetical protein